MLSPPVSCAMCRAHLPRLQRICQQPKTPPRPLPRWPLALLPLAMPQSLRRVTAMARSEGQLHLALTENRAVALETSGEACVDFLFLVVPGIKRDHLFSLLRAAWNEDPLCTMKLVLQLGDPRWGKSDRDNHQLCLLWLWRHFPASVKENVGSGALAEHTCLKGLLDLLMYAAWDDEKFIHLDLEEFPQRGTCSDSKADKKSERFHQRKMQNPERREKQAADRQERIRRFCKILEAEGLQPAEIRRHRTFHDESVPERMPWIEKEEWASEDIKGRFRVFCEELDQARNQKIHEEVKQSRRMQLEQVREKYETDQELAELYVTVAEVFAVALRGLTKIMQKQKNGHELSREEQLKLTGSLYPKWAPTKDGMHDKKTDIVRGIVERIFPEEEFRLPEGTYDDYISFMKDKYRKEVLTPLRRQTEIVESFIGSQNWEEINYNRMPARCRLLYGQSVYAENDRTRYEQHVEAALQGGATIKGQVMPHELVGKAASFDVSDLELKEVQGQWNDLVREVKAAGHLGQCLAVCDVSGSMEGPPMKAAVALSLLICEIARDPWRNRICTFSQDPAFCEIPEGSLRDRAERVESMPWGFNTNYERVFDRILEVATQHRVVPDDMPELLVVLSDMQFDESSSSTNPWATSHENIEAKFRSAGYGMLEIVYWNLRSSAAHGRVPTQSTEKGVVMLSGLSQGLLKSFLQRKLEIPTPLEQMRAIVNTSYYEDVKIAPDDLRLVPPPPLADLLFS